MNLCIGIDFGTSYTIMNILEEDSDNQLNQRLNCCVHHVIDYYGYSYNYNRQHDMIVTFLLPYKLIDIEIELKEIEENNKENGTNRRRICELNKANSYDELELGFIVLPCARRNEIILQILVLAIIKFQIPFVRKLFLIERELKYHMQFLE